LSEVQYNLWGQLDEKIQAKAVTLPVIHLRALRGAGPTFAAGPSTRSPTSPTSARSDWPPCPSEPMVRRNGSAGLSCQTPRFAVPMRMTERTRTAMMAFAYTLIVLLVLTSILLTMLILLHRGKGGGLSSMFGGGVSSSLAGSSVAEKNLDRYTVLIGIVWFACIVGLGLWLKLAQNGAA
jgi:preprotein translocase subunit SecG